MKKILTFFLVLVLIGCSNSSKSVVPIKEEVNSLGLTSHDIKTLKGSSIELYNNAVSTYYTYPQINIGSNTLSLIVYTYSSNEKLQEHYNNELDSYESYGKKYKISENEFGEKGFFYKYGDYTLVFVKNSNLVTIRAAEKIPESVVKKVAEMTVNKI